MTIGDLVYIIETVQASIRALDQQQCTEVADGFKGASRSLCAVRAQKPAMAKDAGCATLPICPQRNI